MSELIALGIMLLVVVAVIVAAWHATRRRSIPEVVIIAASSITDHLVGTEVCFETMEYGVIVQSRGGFLTVAPLRWR